MVEVCGLEYKICGTFRNKWGLRWSLVLKSGGEDVYVHYNVAEDVISSIL